MIYKEKTDSRLHAGGKGTGGGELMETINTEINLPSIGTRTMSVTTPTTTTPITTTTPTATSTETTDNNKYYIGTVFFISIILIFMIMFMVLLK